MSARLEFPGIVQTRSRVMAHGWECLCVVLCYFAVPHRLYDLIKEFGRSETALSELLHGNEMSDCK